MNARVISFRNPASPIAQFIRIGEAHKKLSELHAAGHFPVQRVVVEASRFLHQREFIDALRREGVEIVLDPQTAELASLAKFKGIAKLSPWAFDNRPLGPEAFGVNSPSDVIGQIARFAIENRVHAVLSPTHFLADPGFSRWLQLDRASCIALRSALDREGGQHIAIDYLVLHSHVALNEPSERSALLSALVDVPYQNLWLRPSGLGHEAKPQSTKQFLNAMHSLHNIGKPIIIDHLDGLLGQTVIAYGAASGLAHGILDRNQFDARQWHKPPPPRNEDAPFGRRTYIPVTGMGRSVTKQELEYLASARGGKSLLGGHESNGVSGIQSMLKDPRQHAVRQAFDPIRGLATMPDANREEYFLDKPLRDAERISRSIKDLKPDRSLAEALGVEHDALFKRLADHHGKLQKLGDTLRLIHEVRGKGAPRMPSAGQPRVLNMSNKKEESL